MIACYVHLILLTLRDASMNFLFMDDKNGPERPSDLFKVTQLIIGRPCS